MEGARRAPAVECSAMGRICTSIEHLLYYEWILVGGKELPELGLFVFPNSIGIDYRTGRNRTPSDCPRISLQDWPLAMAVATSSQRLNESSQLLVRFPKLPIRLALSGCQLALSSCQLALSSCQVVQHFHSIKEKLTNRGDLPVVFVEPLSNRQLPHFVISGRFDDAEELRTRFSWRLDA